MPQVTRTYDTNTSDLAYQISRSDGFVNIRDRLGVLAIDEQLAQHEVLELVIGGSCVVPGEHGPEGFRWTISEKEVGQVASQLYRDYLGGA